MLTRRRLLVCSNARPEKQMFKRCFVSLKKRQENAGPHELIMQCTPLSNFLLHDMTMHEDHWVEGGVQNNKPHFFSICGLEQS